MSLSPKEIRVTRTRNLFHTCARRCKKLACVAARGEGRGRDLGTTRLYKMELVSLLVTFGLNCFIFVTVTQLPNLAGHT